MIKRLLLVMLAVVLLPGGHLWAAYGKSNVIEKQLRHTVPAAVPGPDAQPATQAMPEAKPAAQPEPAAALPQMQACVKKIDFPYTVHVLSSQEIASARAEMERLRKKLGKVFITKTDLAASGIWYRVDYGVFVSAREAVMKMRELQNEGLIDKGAFIGGPVPYTIELGTYGAQGQAALNAQAEKLSRSGISSYALEESGGCLRLVTGAFPQMRSANMVLKDLQKQGIKAKITKR